MSKLDFITENPEEDYPTHLPPSTKLKSTNVSNKILEKPLPHTDDLKHILPHINDRTVSATIYNPEFILSDALSKLADGEQPVLPYGSPNFDKVILELQRRGFSIIKIENGKVKIQANDKSTRYYTTV